MVPGYTDGASRMDQMYRYQRYWYDLSRKYYLLGRDKMISDLDVRAGSTVLEVGCGTARNLIQASRRFPDVKFSGFDLSAEMLITARQEIEKAGLADRITVQQADACSFLPQETFGVEGFDRVFIAYSLCIIPDWKSALERAILSVNETGSLHVVDFGQQENLPRWFRQLLLAWLRQFGVFPQSNVADVVEGLAEGSLSIQKESLYRGYAYHIVASRSDV
jgi:S-adenosylmethionine-diacylgycerolhomoserine-N-methlytransferase